MTRDEILTKLTAAFPMGSRPLDLADSSCVAIEQGSAGLYMRILTYRDIADALADPE